MKVALYQGQPSSEGSTTATKHFLEVLADRIFFCIPEFPPESAGIIVKSRNFEYNAMRHLLATTQLRGCTDHGSLIGVGGSVLIGGEDGRLCTHFLFKEAAGF